MRHFALSLTLLTLAACQPKEEAVSASTTATDQYADTVEAGITGAGGAADDASNESVVASSQQSFWGRVLVPEAMAACARTLTNNGGGNCTRNVNCDFGAYLWSGNVQLSFNNGAACSLSGAGDFYTRSVDFARTGPRGTLQTTSNNRTAWDGSVIGGGMQISQVDGLGNLEVDVLGQHKILTRTGGRTVFDVSFSTSAPLAMNQLARNGRVISGGTMVVHHNRARFTAEHTMQNLSFTSGCCYPTSGTITSTFSGSIAGSGSVTFNSCGNYTATLNGVSKTYSLANCE